MHDPSNVNNMAHVRQTCNTRTTLTVSFCETQPFLKICEASNPLSSLKDTFSRRNNAESVLRKSGCCSRSLVCLSAVHGAGSRGREKVSRLDPQPINNALSFTAFTSGTSCVASLSELTLWRRRRNGRTAVAWGTNWLRCASLLMDVA